MVVASCVRHLRSSSSPSPPTSCAQAYRYMYYLGYLAINVDSILHCLLDYNLYPYIPPLAVTPFHKHTPLASKESTKSASSKETPLAERAKGARYRSLFLCYRTILSVPRIEISVKLNRFQLLSPIGSARR